MTDPVTLKLLALEQLWRSRCRDGRLPGRRDFDMPDFKLWLGHIALYDVERDPIRFRMRLAGVRIVDYDGRDYTGRYLDDFIPAAIRDEVAAPFYQALSSRQPVLQDVQRLNRHGTTLRHARLVLPLAADGHQVDMLILCLYIVFPPLVWRRADGRHVLL